jgi:hypothetical protein
MLGGTLPVGPEAMHLYTNRPYLKLFLISLLPLRSEQPLVGPLHHPDRPPIRVDGQTFPLGPVPCVMQDKVVLLDHEVSWNVSALVARAVDSLVRIICRITFLDRGIWTYKPLLPRGSYHPG